MALLFLMNVSGSARIEDNLRSLGQSIISTARKCGRDPKQIRLIVVTKGQSSDIVEFIRNLGYADLGESYMKEFLRKTQKIGNVNWHYIGRFNRSQVNDLVGASEYIHSISSDESLKEVADSARMKAVVQKILLQANISAEPAKQGFSPEHLSSLFQRIDIKDHPSISIVGLMTIAPLSADSERIRKCFKDLRSLKEQLNERYSLNMEHLSMGMTNDYKIAIEEGATFLRIGRGAFRND
jgi:pyridoxal phosphate enzyme (YggS family)